MATKSRREVLRTIAAGGITAATIVAGVQQFTAAGSRATPGDDFDKHYKNRHIHTKMPVGQPGGKPMHPQVFIDDVELHVMMNADLTYTSVIQHYRTYPQLLDVAMAAVDALNGANLVALHGRPR
jgi:Tyrosinase co-factor MelC1